MNLYATKKTVAEGMLDVALFLANVTHMKTVIEQGAGYRYSCNSQITTEDLSGHLYKKLFFLLFSRYYIAVLTLISFSLILQIVAGVLIIIIGEPIMFQHLQTPITMVPNQAH